jgi:hypothetical protein
VGKNGSGQTDDLSAMIDRFEQAIAMEMEISDNIAAALHLLRDAA